MPELFESAQSVAVDPQTSRVAGTSRIQSPWRVWPVVGLCLLLGSAIIWWRGGNRARIERDQVSYWLRGWTASLETALDRDFSALEFLRIALRDNGGRLMNFQQMGSDLLSSFPGLLWIELQPGGATTDIVPRAGNERALNMNVLRDPAAVRAIQTRKLVATGPWTLLGKQSGVIARVPVFLRDANARESFWGFVSGGIRLPTIAAQAELEQLAARGYNCVFYAIPPQSRKPVTIARFGTAVRSDAIRQSIRVDGTEFCLAVDRPRSWGGIFSTLIDAGILIMLASLLALHFRARERIAGLHGDLEDYANRLAIEHDHAASAESQLRSAHAANAAELKASIDATTAVRERLGEVEEQLRLERMRGNQLETELARMQSDATELATAKAAVLDLQAKLNDREAGLQSTHQQLSKAQEELQTLRIAAENAAMSELSANPSPSDAGPAQIIANSMPLPVAESAPESELEIEVNSVTETITPESPQPASNQNVEEASQEASSLPETPVNESAPIAVRLEKTTRRKKSVDDKQLSLFAADDLELSVPNPPESEPPESSEIEKTEPPHTRESDSAEIKLKPAPLPRLNLPLFRKAANVLFILLTESDPGAKDCLADNRKVLRSAFIPETFEEFEKHIKASAFTEALELLIKTAKRHKINL